MLISSSSSSSGLQTIDPSPGTIPVNIIYTTARPDIVVINGKSITLPDLTISMNTKDGLSNARERKHAKENYISLLGDLNSRSYSINLMRLVLSAISNLPLDHLSI
uniref:Uncharacterized protein n=1 Tax=Amphimedon queenslandica TaxID=400682 RepID=A0A1X7U536_AMPQE